MWMKWLAAAAIFAGLSAGFVVLAGIVVGRRRRKADAYAELGVVNAHRSARRDDGRRHYED